MTEIASGKILHRALSKEASREVREVGGPALREVEDECTRVFERCSASARGTDEHIGLLFPFLQLAELLDSAEVSLAEASTVGASVILRAALESLLTVEWVGADASMRYGAAYVVTDIHRRIAGLEQFLPSGTRRKQREASMRADALGADIELPTLPDAQERIDGFRELLKEQHLAAAAEEYARRRKGGGKVEFFSLWDGPRGIEQLALKLNRGGQYDFLYRSWSRLVHSADVMRQLTSSEGSAAVQAFRSGEGLSDSYTFAIAFGLDGMRVVLGRYRPDELAKSYPEWYKVHISNALRRLSTAKASSGSPAS